ncbi:hypothetical protein MLD38_007259 [Melastoma candidum]|uniref:Uncharacterized protein n=1 Tax=Melastoma candidum TaxID=119954 RepID=A0ACB9RRS1_9MYRT|nr:hypothetical protein MLD38_007259 [Melastoma candidum]
MAISLPRNKPLVGGFVAESRCRVASSVAPPSTQLLHTISSAGFRGRLFQRRRIGSKYDDGLTKNFAMVPEQLAPDDSAVGECMDTSSNILACGGGSSLSEKLREPTRFAEANEQPGRSLQTELIILSLPAIAGQAIEPLTQLMETAYIGQLGSLELAAAGVSMSIFNIVSKVLNIPLLSVATSFVAEDVSTTGSYQQDQSKRKPLPSVSTTLILAVVIGIFEGAALYFGCQLFLDIIGISTDSSMRVLAERFLKLRAIGAPAVVLYMAIQAIFRGFKDTKTPVWCLGIGNLSAVLMFPTLIYYFQLGVAGAAISSVLSQIIVMLLMLWHLNKRTLVEIPDMNNLQLGGYLRSGGLLVGRTAASVMTITMSTSMAARQGAIAVAAHQICLQVWLSASLVIDAQAGATQAMIAGAFAKREFKTVKELTYYALQNGLITGLSLALLLGTSFASMAAWFTNDPQVLKIVRSGTLFVSGTMPLNAFAYIFDGLHYGISDFKFAAYSMMVAGSFTCILLLQAPSFLGLSGIWIGLAIFMGIRAIAGFMRLYSKNGPWKFLREESYQL